MHYITAHFAEVKPVCVMIFAAQHSPSTMLRYAFIVAIVGLFLVFSDVSLPDDAPRTTWVDEQVRMFQETNNACEAWRRAQLVKVNADCAESRRITDLVSPFFGSHPVDDQKLMCFISDGGLENVYFGTLTSYKRLKENDYDQRYRID